VFDVVGHLLTATKRTVIATGILNLWMHSAGDVAQSYATLTDGHGEKVFPREQWRRLAAVCR
jgi:hypothetical protein